MTYAIKDTYTARDEPAYFVDSHPATHQPLVYEYAAVIHGRYKLAPKVMVDVGCGRGRKLAEQHERRGDWRFVGIDYGPNIEWCRSHYAFGEWLDVNLEEPHRYAALNGVVVCSDVIEHLKDPSNLLAGIRDSGCAAAVFSTPERDLYWGEGHNGPPPNPCHVREWNLAEFCTYLDGEGFHIESANCTPSDDCGTGDKTILVWAELK